MTTSFLSDKFEWINHPLHWKNDEHSDLKEVIGEKEGSGGGIDISENELKIRPAAYKDFWSKTYYSPTLIKNDACGYLYPINSTEEATIKVDFTLTPILQFDQAGILIHIDDQHWVKIGIEYCDGVPRLSVVVTNGYSDWSTQPWPSTSARLKIHKVNQGSSIVVEAAPIDTEHYQFVRIAHVSSNVSGEDGVLPVWKVGPFAACPTKQKGCEAIFRNFSISSREPSVHHQDVAAHDN